MSRKTQRNRDSQPPRPSATDATQQTRQTRRWVIVVSAIVGLLLASAAAMILNERKMSPTPAAAPTTVTNQAALVSSHAPTLGDPGARVHIVEFIDPACETCAQFYPLVKQLMAQNPGRIRLSLRHVAFHDGSDYVVRLLEASRGQDKYWETLEALLASQASWAPNHTVQPELAMQAISGVGLEIDRLTADMSAPEVAQRIAQDRSDAMALKVTATPGYFVNGRPLPSFGQQQLLALVAEELQRAN